MYVGMFLLINIKDKKRDDRKLRLFMLTQFTINTNTQNGSINHVANIHALKHHSSNVLTGFHHSEMNFQL